MAASSQSFSVGLDTDSVSALAELLLQVSTQNLGPMLDGTVNTVADEVDQQSEDETFAYLNVTRDYIREKMSKVRANKGSARALVRARIEGATMQNFGRGIEIKSEPVNWTNATILAKRGKFDPYWQGWTERKGDPSRSIAPDRKAAGAKVRIFRGRGAEHFDYGFTQTLLNGNGTGLFLRGKDGSVRHAYGPSVYQTFRKHITTNADKIADRLAGELTARLDDTLNKVFT